LYFIKRKSTINTPKEKNTVRISFLILHLLPSFSVGADVIFKELRFAQSKDDFLRKSTMGSDMFEYNDDDLDSEDGGGGQLLTGKYDEKTSAASFQQALQQWRQGGDKKKPPRSNRSKRNTLTHEAAVDTAHDSNGKFNMPNIEFHSSKLTYGEKLLLKKYRRANKNNQEFFHQRVPSTNMTSRIPSNNIHVNRSLPEHINLKDANIEIEVYFNIFKSIIDFILLFSHSMMIYQQCVQKIGMSFIRN
jgi:hypothetical protein